MFCCAGTKSRGGGDSKVENLSADFRFFFACMLLLGVGKNKNSLLIAKTKGDDVLVH